jgi:hypothetical protein
VEAEKVKVAGIAGVSVIEAGAAVTPEGKLVKVADTELAKPFDAFKETWRLWLAPPCATLRLGRRCRDGKTRLWRRSRNYVVAGASSARC